LQGGDKNVETGIACGDCSYGRHLGFSFEGSFCAKVRLRAKQAAR
jgi:hypothetical protein